MINLPRLALSVRQPWAWAIVHAGKDIENRSWRSGNPGLRFRGDFAVHASKGMTREEYEDARDFMERFGVFVPAPADLLRGGIIGIATVVDVVRQSESDWFMGPCGLQLANPRSVPLIPAVGALGYFEWIEADAAIVPTPAKWMQAAPVPADAAPATTVVQGSLF